MTPNEYQKMALRTEFTPCFVARPDHDERLRLSRLVHAALGVGTEAGELQDALKKSIMYGKPLDPVNVMEECGDLMWYIALALAATGYTMEEAMERNIAKLRRRFPEKFTSENALTRDLSAERTALEETKP